MCSLVTTKSSFSHQTLLCTHYCFQYSTKTLPQAEDCILFRKTYPWAISISALFYWKINLSQRNYRTGCERGKESEQVEKFIQIGIQQTNKSNLLHLLCGQLHWVCNWHMSLSSFYLLLPVAIEELDRIIRLAICFPTMFSSIIQKAHIDYITSLVQHPKYTVQ